MKTGRPGGNISKGGRSGGELQGKCAQLCLDARDAAFTAEYQLAFQPDERFPAQYRYIKDGKVGK